LTGTRWLVDSDVYPEKLTSRGLTCVRPNVAEREEINRIIFDELVNGIFKPEAVACFQDVIGRMKNDGCDAVVLGCTEIPLIMSDANSPLPTLDSTRLLARAALRRATTHRGTEVNDRLLFRRAVSAIDAGDVAALADLIAEHPALVRERLDAPGGWLRDTVKGALDGFFKAPYLLWFVAEDPVRNGTLPKNIADITRTIVSAIKRENVGSLQAQLDYALNLVSWSWIARDSGVQIALIDVLIDEGATIDGNPENALVNGNVDAARHLVERGARLSLATALCLERWNDAERLAARRRCENVSSR
jgi:hypothetical protein